IAQSIYDATGIIRRRWLSLFSYNRTVTTAVAGFAVGAFLVARFVFGFVQASYQIEDSLITSNHQAILGLFLTFSSILIFGSMLVIQAINLYFGSSNNALR